MATTKKTTRKTTTSTRKGNDNLAARTGRTIKNQPYVSAAIATGAVTAIAAAAAGAYFFRKSDKTVGEIAEDVSDKVKDGIGEAKIKARDVASKAKSKARSLKSKASTYFDDADRDQADITAEALTLKETGTKTQRPIDPTIEKELKTGAIAY